MHIRADTLACLLKSFRFVLARSLDRNGLFASERCAIDRRGAERERMQCSREGHRQPMMCAVHEKPAPEGVLKEVGCKRWLVVSLVENVDSAVITTTVIDRLVELKTPL